MIGSLAEMMISRSIRILSICFMTDDSYTGPSCQSRESIPEKNVLKLPGLYLSSEHCRDERACVIA